jgi:hypothetical protein
MPAFTFTADSATDQLTITAHGLPTGAGPATVRTVGGALPTASPALTAQADYWVINTGANTIKLATSSANALAGVAIDILTNGSGTNKLEIGIPYRRPQTYIPNVSQVSSADLNANFDAWKDLHALLTGQSQSVWSGVQLLGILSAADIKYGDRSLAIPAASFTVTSNVAGVPTYSTDWSGFGSPPNDTVRAGAQIESGCRIKSLTWHINKGSSSALLNCSLVVRNGTTVTTIDSLADASSGAAYTTVLRTLGTPYVIADGDAITLAVQGTNSAHRFSHVVIVYDRPQI